MRSSDPLSKTARGIEETRRILASLEAQALTGVAATLAKTARELKGITPDEWMTAEEAAAYLKRTPKAFEKVVAAGEIPRHYLTERVILFSRKELDEWLMGR